MKKIALFLLTLVVIMSSTNLEAQRNKKTPEKEPSKISLDAFKFRHLGPAFLSGRIAEIAVHPNNDNIWYVAVGSGGVWKTENSGTTWKPIFDKEVSYSTGCITIDSNDPARIWVGSGENVGGRHVGYGDGVYLSTDSGSTWKNMGLKKSEHISKIIVHPTNSNIVWVASQGPLWKKGGERGVYKTVNGGKTWKRVLGNSEWTGATDIMIDPNNPNLVYAATWDRHRTVAAYMGGGPGSGIHRSTDGGETWEKLSTGLPKSNMGKIGLAMSYQKSNVIYAAIELDRTTGGVYRSEDGGSSWKKMSDTVSGATGPHYYQELYTSPHKFDRLYLMNVRVLTSEDGGKTFERLKEEKKHSDNHALVFKKDDPNYLMLGTDAGIYESFDLAKNWRYIKNLPLTQFYKVAVNNAEPFYHIFGGTQDNGSVGGPSATDEQEGIANKHWYKTLFADGHQSATDPEYNDIIYAETQQGGLHRIDLTSGERVFVQPQAQEEDPFERFNWDAPILVSPHNPARLYFASQRVWKSESRGDEWTPISTDLTRNENRIELPIMGRKQSWDNPWDVGAMSNYNSITSLSESPIIEGVLFAGTDDGSIQVTQNGGEQWNRIPVSRLGIPDRSFVNDIKADLYNANTVYVVLDNHKAGDFNPYIFKSTDLGATWTSISSNLPKRTLVWRIVQDHINKDLFFAATEFGIYVSMNAGKEWQKLPGTPTLPFRDLVIQKRENDLVAASFGRGFYVLDDYSALREITPDNLKQKGKLFAPRVAKWYIPRSSIGNTGADYYFSKNPDFGAVFTYHLSDDFTTMKAKRQKKEKELNKKSQNVPFPGWDTLDKESQEKPAKVLLTIEDSSGNIIRKIRAKAKKGSQRITWDLKHFNPFSVPEDGKVKKSNFNSGALATPQKYNATLYLENNGKVTKLDGPVSFDVKPIREGVLKGVSYEAYDNYRKTLSRLVKKLDMLEDVLERSEKKIAALKTALNNSGIAPVEMSAKIKTIHDEIINLKSLTKGSSSKSEIGERNNPTVQTHLWAAFRGMRSTYGPTPMHQKSMGLAQKMAQDLERKIKDLSENKIATLEKEMKDKGIPYIKGQSMN